MLWCEMISFILLMHGFDYFYCANPSYRITSKFKTLINRPSRLKSTEASIISKDENDAKHFLQEYNKRYAKVKNKHTIASWNYETNLTEENADAAASADLMVGDYFDIAH